MSFVRTTNVRSTFHGATCVPAVSHVSVGPRPPMLRRLPRAKVCLGMPLFNQTNHLVEAIESLLRQTHEDFRLVVADDSTSDEPGRIVRRFAELDPRIEYHRNDRRLGMVDNWRKAFELAGPDCEYFAWVADHDRWDECWLEEMLDGLKSDPQAMLCYPCTVRLNEDGSIQYGKKLLEFDTTGLSRWDRCQAVCRQLNGMGSMVYGLFRARGLKQAGVFRRTLLPDVVLMVELSLYGTIKQIPKELWHRRYIKSFSLDRQRSSLFVRPPLHVRLPLPLVVSHTAMLFWLHAAGPRAGALRHRARGLALCGQFFFWFSLLRCSRWSIERRKAFRRTRLYQAFRSRSKSAARRASGLPVRAVRLFQRIQPKKRAKRLAATIRIALRNILRSSSFDEPNAAA